MMYEVWFDSRDESVLLIPSLTLKSSEQARKDYNFHTEDLAFKLSFAADDFDDACETRDRCIADWLMMFRGT